MNQNEIKFLIIRFSSIGDIVLTTPVVRCLKQQLDGAVIHYLTKPQYATILETNLYIDKVHTLKDFRSTIAELKAENFDYLIDLHKNIRTYRFKDKLKILDFTFPKLNYKKFLLTNFKIDKLPDIHIVDRYFEAVKVFDIKNDNKGLDYFIENHNVVNINELNLNFSTNEFIAFAIGGQHNTKKMPNHKIIEICNKIDVPVILLGSKEDFDNANEICKHTQNTHNFCGKLNLSQSASIIFQSKAVITHDTGLMHIASAFKKNIISLWGNTVPKFGMYPYQAGELSQICEVKNLKCRPCSKIGYKKCPKKHFDCMEKQNVNEITMSIVNCINGVKVS